MIPFRFAWELFDDESPALLVSETSSYLIIERSANHDIQLTPTGNTFAQLTPVGSVDAQLTPTGDAWE